MPGHLESATRLWAFVALACLSAWACALRLAAPAAPLDAGTLYLYLEPAPPGAARLRVEIVALAAIDEDGASHRLDLRLEVLEGSATPRQRLLAMGTLPEKRYRGLAVTTASARLSGSKGPGALVTSVEPTVIEVPFAVARERATVLMARLQPEASILEGRRFEPVFTVGPPGDLAPGLFALATSRDDAALVLFHKLSGEVFDVLRTGAGPAGVALDRDRPLAFVASTDEDLLETYDLARRVRDQRLPLLAGDRPLGIALSGDGRTLVCAHSGSNVLGIYDAPVLTERFRVPIGLEPRAVLLDREARRAFTFDTGSDSLTVVDVRAGVVVATIATDDGPFFGALDRAERRLYVVHRSSPHVDVVDLVRLQVERRIYVGMGTTAIATDPRTDRILLARRGAGRIEVFDPTSLLPVDEIVTGRDADFLVVSSEGDNLYAAIPGAREIQAIRLAGYRVTHLTETGGDPAWIAVAGGR